MAEKANASSNRTNRNEQNKPRKSNDLQLGQNFAAISRERSFVRTSNQQQNSNKRRSLAFISSAGQPGNTRDKATVDIYRPPKHSHNLQHSMSSSVVFPMLSTAALNRHQVQFVPSVNAPSHRRRIESSGTAQSALNTVNRMGRGNTSLHITYLNNNIIKGNVPISNSVSRVKFSPEISKEFSTNDQSKTSFVQKDSNQKNYSQYSNGDDFAAAANALKRSKSLSSADILTRGFASLGLGLGREVSGIGEFTPDVQALINVALENPNKLNARCLMELTSQFIKRTVEGRRYALPISKLCLNIIAGESKETFLEALLNTCRQWYQEREKLLFAIHGMKSPSRARFTAFMAFLTEMFCQLKRRQLQMRSQSEGAPPHLVLLTLLSKCCEECVTSPVRSLSEIECLFYVLTCIGQDMELQLPQQLEGLMSLVRDAFLNASDSAPSIRRTLLQLIELKASHWQLPGNTVLYYYPTTKQ